MTIIYQYRVATTSLGGFLRLLAAWRGSVYKLLYKEAAIFALLYAALSLLYRLALSPAQRTEMERVVIQCDSYTSFIPISFVLGFYVTVVVQRWWQQFINVPWPDRTVFVMCTYLNGQEERSRMMRRSVARYMMFGLILIMRAVSVAVMKRFPTIDTIVQAGYITKEEAEAYEAVQCRYLKFWVPLMWANNILARARREGRIETEFGLRMVLEQLADFRDKCSLCFVYDWITIPLVYTQVVTLAVYSFFAACLLGRQFLDPSKGYKGYEYDSYVPVFTFLQFLFYMGWLKVAEQMINPFGEDDDDYDINWLMDRHAAVAFALVDQCCGRHPPLIRDPFWEETVMPEMPYTEAAQSSKRPNFLGSTFNIHHLSSEEQPAYEQDRLRRRSHGSFAGSVISLLGAGRHHGRHLSGSHDTLDAGDNRGRYLSMPNGHAAVYSGLPRGSKVRSVSLDMSNTDVAARLQIPGRERSNSERSEDGAPSVTSASRVRKLSSPPKFHLPVSSSPKSHRFLVEMVPERGNDSEQEEAESRQSIPKTRRSGHPVLAAMLAGGAGGNKAVSRPPLLSAIEEGGTVSSLRHLLTPHINDDLDTVNGLSDEAWDHTASGLEDISEAPDERDDVIGQETSMAGKGQTRTSSPEPQGNSDDVNSGLYVTNLARCEA